VDLLNNNGFVDLDGNYTLACNVHTVNEVDNVQLWTNITGSWALTETMEGGFSADQGEFADVQYSHVRATDGTEYQDQIKFDGTWLSPRYTVTKAELCTRRMSASSGNLSDDDITAWRVDDQGWSSVSITTGEYNAQSKTNETISNRTEENIHGSPNWWCFDITNPVIETQAQSDTFVTIRWEDPDNAVATANALNFFTEYLWLGNTTIYENHCYNGAICGAINTPFMRVTYFDSSSSIANFTVTDTVDGEYIWNCKGMDKDSPPNNAWAPANYSYTVGVVSESDPCACPGYGENYDIPLENHCHINTTCDVGTGLVTFTGTGSYTLNATLNGTILGLDINGSTTLNVGSNGSLNLNP